MSYLTYYPRQIHLKWLLIKLEMVGKSGGGKKRSDKLVNKQGGHKASGYYYKHKLAQARWLSWLECCPTNQKVEGSIPGQGTCLGYRPPSSFPHLMCERQLIGHISLSLPSPLSISVSSGEDKTNKNPQTYWSLQYFKKHKEKLFCQAFWTKSPFKKI